VFQYDRLLKTKWKYHKVRRRTSGVATFPYGGLPKPCNEVVLKYGNGDISESSWVFRCPKDSEARDGPLLSKSTTQKLMEVDIFQYETTEAKVSVR